MCADRMYFVEQNAIYLFILWLFTPHFQNNEFQDTLWFTLLISKLWFGLIKWLIQNKNDETFFHS